MSDAKVAKNQDNAQPPEKLKGKDYEWELAKLHVELVKLQEWVRHNLQVHPRRILSKGAVIVALKSHVAGELS